MKRSELKQIIKEEIIKEGGRDRVSVKKGKIDFSPFFKNLLAANDYLFDVSVAADNREQVISSINEIRKHLDQAESLMHRFLKKQEVKVK